MIYILKKNKIYTEFYTLLFKSCGLTFDLSLTLAFVFSASAVLAAFKRGVGSFKACKHVHKNVVVTLYKEYRVTITINRNSDISGRENS